VPSIKNYYYTPLVTLYEDNKSPFLLKSFIIFFVTVSHLYEGEKKGESGHVLLEAQGGQARVLALQPLAGQQRHQHQQQHHPLQQVLYVVQIPAQQ
jgi:hypothetical protein